MFSYCFMRTYLSITNQKSIIIVFASTRIHMSSARTVSGYVPQHALDHLNSLDLIQIFNFWRSSFCSLLNTCES